MSVNNTSRVVRLREFLVSEGWVLDRRLEETRGEFLLTHPDHPRRQLCIPTDATRWEDWSESCERAVEKAAEMTNRDSADLWALIDGPSRGHRTWRMLRCFAGSAVIACAATVISMTVWESATAEPPVSVALAGCMDSQGALAVAGMAYDVRIRSAGIGDEMKDVAWTRWRALQAAANIEEMRKCYLEAQSYSHGFDAEGLIGDDLRRIEDGVKTVYAHIGASLVPGNDATDVERSAAQESFRQAEAAAGRMSIRLGKIVSAWYL
ncbi:hypothetical protein HFN89_04180 [Rhizobium laguerreae]|nr:hypothetical protein [Rhizobium laguerreae]